MLCVTACCCWSLPDVAGGVQLYEVQHGSSSSSSNGQAEILLQQVGWLEKHCGLALQESRNICVTILLLRFVACVSGWCASCHAVGGR
jgi:hypothetical protein